MRRIDTLAHDALAAAAAQREVAPKSVGVYTYGRLPRMNDRDCSRRVAKSCSRSSMS